MRCSKCSCDTTVLVRKAVGAYVVNEPSSLCFGCYDQSGIMRFLQKLGWKMDDFIMGECVAVSADREYAVTVGKSGWNLGKFTDSDVDGRAQGRYQTVEDGDGETLIELEQALVENKLYSCTCEYWGGRRTPNTDEPCEFHYADDAAAAIDSSVLERV